ncbi:hypothetical protein [Pseudonocardia sp. KRD291]|uniref:hypothetical protein n=1 Tax=Pseudonocardia sp. KRD291 TaxID=2792007 RepID=UPI001C49F915|nr:hypothetical protein [Pseudonocardia sp. KRD291]MBW0104144.1 hypothetical protein [Pseudonocardia sp. KRD291]
MNDASAHAPTRAERRSARLNDPRFDRFRSTTARRRLVIAMAVMIALEGFVLALSGLLGGGPVLVVAASAGVLVLLVGFVLCLGTLKVSTRGVEELGPDQLDERQLQVRGVVYAQAYKIGSGLLVALLAAIVLWSMFVGTNPPSTVVTAVLLVSFHLTIVLPTLVAAWHERV